MRKEEFFMKWKTRLAVLAAAMYIPAGVLAFDYNLSIDEISEHPLTAYNTVYLGMPKKDFALNFSILPDWTFYGSDGTTEKAERSVTQDGVTVIEGLSIETADGSPAGRVLAFENYFRTTNRKTARDMYARLSATIYSNMEDFPASQNSKEIRWIQNDVTIVTRLDDKKDGEGYYTVLIRRYNNHVLSE